MLLTSLPARDKCNENRNDNAELGHDPPHNLCVLAGELGEHEPGLPSMAAWQMITPGQTDIGGL